MLFVSLLIALSCTPASTSSDTPPPITHSKIIYVEDINFTISLPTPIANNFSIPDVNIENGKIKLEESSTKIVIEADNGTTEIDTQALTEKWNNFDKNNLPTGIKGIKIEVGSKTTTKSMRVTRTSTPTVWFTFIAEEDYLFKRKDYINDDLYYNGTAKIEINTDGAVIANAGDTSQGGCSLQLKSENVDIPLKNIKITSMTEMKMLLGENMGYTIENENVDIDTAKITADVKTKHGNKIYKGDLGYSLENDCSYTAKPTPENSVASINYKSYDAKTDTAPPTAVIKVRASRGYGFGTKAAIIEQDFDITFSATGGYSFAIGSLLIRDSDINTKFIKPEKEASYNSYGVEIESHKQYRADIGKFVLDSKNNTAIGKVFSPLDYFRNPIYVSKKDIQDTFKKFITDYFNYDGLSIERIKISDNVIYNSSSDNDAKYEVSITLSPLDGRRFETPNSSSDPSKTIKFTIDPYSQNTKFGKVGDVGKIGNIHGRDNLLKMGFRENNNPDERRRVPLASDINSFADLKENLKWHTTYHSYITKMGYPNQLNTFKGYEDIVNKMGYTGNEDVNVASDFYSTESLLNFNVVVKDRTIAAFMYTEAGVESPSYFKYDLIIFDEITGKGYVVDDAGESTYLKSSAVILHEIDKSIGLANLKVYVRGTFFPTSIGDDIQFIVEAKTDGDLTLEEGSYIRPQDYLLTEAYYRRMGISKSESAGIRTVDDLAKVLEKRSKSWQKHDKTYMYKNFRGFDDPIFEGLYQPDDIVDLYYLDIGGTKTKPVFRIDDNGIQTDGLGNRFKHIVSPVAEPKQSFNYMHFVTIVIKDNGMGYVRYGQYSPYRMPTMSQVDHIYDPDIYNNNHKIFISISEIADITIPIGKDIIEVKPRPTTP